MRTWKRARVTVPCGSCSDLIRGPRGDKPGDVLLEVEVLNGAVKLARCPSCAFRLFGEQPPTEIPDERLKVPALWLPIEPMRNADFATPGRIRRGRQVTDFRRLASGESE